MVLDYIFRVVFDIFVEISNNIDNFARLAYLDSGDIYKKMYLYNKVLWIIWLYSLVFYISLQPIRYSQGD